MKNSTPSLSIVIPTWNAGEELPRLLAQIRRQSQYANAEIVVVDSSSNDGTPDRARDFGARVISIQQSDFNHGDSRNLGVEESQGDFVCLFTQDALPKGDRYLQTLVRSVEQNQTAGGFARQIPRPDASPLVRRDLEAWIAGSPERQIKKIESRTAFFSQSPFDRYAYCVFDNVASLIRREVWEVVPFPRVPFGEDIEWAYRVLCNGYSLVYEPDAVVVHSHERSPEYAFKRTAIDHYRLYQLFGLQTVPTRRQAVRGFLTTALKDALYLAGRPKLSTRWIEHLLDVPRFAWSSAWGQYCGAKSAAQGLPAPISREV